MTVSTDADTWYDVRVIADGDNVQFWRNARGELPAKIHDFTVYQTTSTSLKIGPHTDAPIHFDDFRVLASAMSRTTTFVYASNNELSSMSDYNGTATFTYDDWGRTATEVKNGVTKTYSWTMANMLAGIESDDVDDVDVQYLYRGDLKRIVRATRPDPDPNYTWQTIYNYDAGFNVVSEEDVVGPGDTPLARTYVAGLAEIMGSNPATGTPRYLGLLVHHAAIVHLGEPRSELPDLRGQATSPKSNTSRAQSRLRIATAEAVGVAPCEAGVCAFHPAGPQPLRGAEIDVESLVLMFNSKTLLERQSKKGFNDHLIHIPVSYGPMDSLPFQEFALAGEEALRAGDAFRKLDGPNRLLVFSRRSSLLPPCRSAAHRRVLHVRKSAPREG